MIIILCAQCHHSCWMSVDGGTIFGFVGPTLVIVLVSTHSVDSATFSDLNDCIQINIAFLVLALQTLWNVKRDQHQKQKDSKFQVSQKLGR